MTALPDLVEDRVAPSLPGATVRGPVVDAGPGEVLLRVPPGRFLVRRDEPVRLERAPRAADADVRCFLEGPVVAASAFLRGLLPLRAAAVVVAGRAVAIVGASAAGKSAVAAALAQRGHAVLSDAVTPVALTAQGPTVEPVAPEPVLWPDMVEALGLDPDAGRIVRPALPKRAFRLARHDAPAPLGFVVLLRRDGRLETPAIHAVTGAESVALLPAASWHRPLVEPLGLSVLRFDSLHRIASATRFARLERPSHASPTELAAMVEELAA